MAERENGNDWWLLLVRALAVIAGLNCVIVPMLFAQQRPLFPLPGLYLVEIATLGVLGLTGLLLVEPHAAVWRAVPWIAAGALLAFVVLGGFSIGFFLIPAALAFVAAGLLMSRIMGDPATRYIGLMLVAAILQAAVMLLLVQIA